MEKRYYQSVDETVYHLITNNGLNVYIIKKEGFNTKSAFFATKFGSFNTNDILQKKDKKIEIIGGLAHFLEHRVFDYKDGNVIDLFYKLGADVNAYTSYDRTVYYFSTTSNFKECLNLLLDFPTSFTMTKEAVENEKDIIVNELLMYKDDPNDKLFKSLMAAMYKEHPIRYDVGGEVEEVRATSRELLKDVHSTFYNPKNMYLVIVGDIDLEETIKIIENKQFQENTNSYIKKESKETQNIIKDKVICYGDVNNVKMLVGYKLLPLNDLDKFEQARTFISLDLLTSILFSTSSDFYKEIIDKKYVSSLAIDMLEYEGVFAFLVECDLLKDEDKVYELIDKRLKDALNIINEEKLNSIKKKQIATFIKNSDSCLFLAKQYMSTLLDDMDYFGLIDIIKSIDINDLKKVYLKYFSEINVSRAIIRKKEND